nr:NADH dehydrogenase subunit 4L [Dromaeolus sp. ZM-2022]
MMNLYLTSGICLFYLGLLSFCFKSNYFLLILLTLEFIVLILYFMLNLYMYMWLCDYYVGLIYITVAVCEGSLGLSILVSLIHSFGNDFFQSFNILW